MAIAKLLPNGTVAVKKYSTHVARGYAQHEQALPKRVESNLSACVGGHQVVFEHLRADIGSKTHVSIFSVSGLVAMLDTAPSAAFGANAVSATAVS